MTLSSHSGIPGAADMPMEHFEMKVEKLYKFAMSTLPGKEAVKAQNSRT